MATKNEIIIQEQTAEIERLRKELEQVKTSGEPVYPLPHTLRKGVGDLWRGNVRGRERPDNVPQVDGSVTPGASGPSNQDVVEFMAAQAIAEAQKQG
jgi:Mg-chelatase subunit ChlD